MNYPDDLIQKYKILFHQKNYKTKDDDFVIGDHQRKLKFIHHTSNY